MSSGKGSISLIGLGRRKRGHATEKKGKSRRRELGWGVLLGKERSPRNQGHGTIKGRVPNPRPQEIGAPLRGEKEGGGTLERVKIAQPKSRLRAIRPHQSKESGRGYGEGGTSHKESWTCYRKKKKNKKSKKNFQIKQFRGSII